MALQAISLQCPNCGAGVSTEMNFCEFCGGPVVIRNIAAIDSFSPLQLNKMTFGYQKALGDNPDNPEVCQSLGLCYLKLKMYDKALEFFEKATVGNFENSAPYFYAAVSVLKGQKPFLLLRPDIDKAEEYLNAAIMIEPMGIYYYLQAYIKNDYFHRKYFNTSPTYQQALQSAHAAGCTQKEADDLFKLLNTPKPQGF